jgi:hypothetical protein
MSLFTPTRPIVLAALLLGLLAGPGCDRGRAGKEAQAKLAQAEALYAELVGRGVHPRDPAFDAAIAAFEAVPPGTPARQAAEQRLGAIRALRGTLPPRPLATPGATGLGTDAVDAQRATCEALAKTLGATPAEQRQPVLEQLAACRDRLARLEAHRHAAESGLPHAHEAHEAPDAGR